MITEDRASKLFEAIETIRDFIPEAAAIAEIAFPGAAPAIEIGSSVLGKIFEIVVSLRGATSHEDAAAKLRARTLGAWRAGLAANAVYPREAPVMPDPDFGTGGTGDGS